jgi:hypothetical protein
VKIKTQSTITITMTGADAQRLAEWMYREGADKQSGPVEELYLMLRDLPEEVEEVDA